MSRFACGSPKMATDLPRQQTIKIQLFPSASTVIAATSIVFIYNIFILNSHLFICWLQKHSNFHVLDLLGPLLRHKVASKWVGVLSWSKLDVEKFSVVGLFGCCFFWNPGPATCWSYKIQDYGEYIENMRGVLLPVQKREHREQWFSRLDKMQQQTEFGIDSKIWTGTYASTGLVK